MTQLQWKPVTPEAGELGKEYICLDRDEGIITQLGSSNTWKRTVTHWLCETPGKPMNIDDLVREHAIHEFTVSASAHLARALRRTGGEFKFTSASSGGLLNVVIGADDSVVFGCKSFSWEEVDAYARKKGFWS